MSILRKIPKIEQVLDNMSIESLKRLESLMNSGNGATETYTLFGGENKLNYVNKDLGVWYCNIELERNKSVETGFLIWESQTKALFVSYDITQCLKEYEIDLTNYTYTKINEKLSIEEFRRVLEDNINKEVVHIDTTGNVEIGKNLVVDGKVILNGKEDLVDTSGNVLISGGGLTFPTTSPSSQVIPSITTSNTQQNLTIGNGLEIKNGALQEKVLNVSITDILTDATKIQTIFTAMQSTPASKTHTGIFLDNNIPFSAFQDCDKIVLDLSGLSALGLNIGGELIFIKGFNTNNYGRAFYLNYMTGSPDEFSIATVVLASASGGNGLNRLVVEHSGTH